MLPIRSQMFQAFPSSHDPPLCAAWHPFDYWINPSGMNTHKPCLLPAPNLKVLQRTSCCAVSPPTFPPTPPHAHGPTYVFEKCSDLWFLFSITTKPHWTVSRLERGIQGYSKSVCPSHGHSDLIPEETMFYSLWSQNVLLALPRAAPLYAVAAWYPHRWPSQSLTP